MTENQQHVPVVQEPVHEPQQCRFTLGQGEAMAVLDYRLSGDHTVNFYHTYVPPALRGQGIAERLVRHGLAWAREQQLAITASCWYVQKFL